jgi:hypothetical protein
LIPAGTGLQSLRDLKVIKEGGNLLYDSEQSDEVQSDKLASAKAMLSLDD